MKRIVRSSLTTALKELKEGKETSVRLVANSLDLLNESNRSNCNIFVSKHDESKLRRDAEEADSQYQRLRNVNDSVPLLLGVPLAIKDNFAECGEYVTCGSSMLKDFKCPYNSDAVERLKQSGAILIGRTNMDEFGMGSSTTTSIYGPCRNPHDVSLLCGGSSGGSAAAVSAGIVFAALGSDTGGSVRQPAALCHVVGFKPSYGRVSRYGLVAYASSLDTVGWCTSSVAGALLLLHILQGTDIRDATTRNADKHIAASPPRSSLELRIGVVRECAIAELDGEIQTVWKSTIEKVVQMDPMTTTATSVSVPSWKHALSSYYVIACAEATSNLARYDGLLYGGFAPTRETSDIKDVRSSLFGAEVKRRVLAGAAVLSRQHAAKVHKRAQRVRQRVINELEEVFNKVDVLIVPVVMQKTMKMKGNSHGLDSDSSVHEYGGDVYTVVANLAGLPACSVPVGGTEGYSLQVIGKRWDDETVLRVASMIETMEV